MRAGNFPCSETGQFIRKVTFTCACHILLQEQVQNGKNHYNHILIYFQSGLLSMRMPFLAKMKKTVLL